MFVEIPNTHDKIILPVKIIHIKEKKFVTLWYKFNNLVPIQKVSFGVYVE